MTGDTTTSDRSARLKHPQVNLLGIGDSGEATDNGHKALMPVITWRPFELDVELLP